MTILAGTAGHSRSSRIRRLLLCSLLGVLATTFELTPIMGQPRSNRDQLDKLLESLIESEIERRDFADPRMTAPLSAAPKETRLTARQLDQARRLLDTFSRDSNNLLYALADHDRAVGGLRELLSDALQIRASASVLAQRAARATDAAAIQTEFQNLDRQWRALSYALQNVRGLPRTITDSVRAMDTTDRELSQLLQISPQLNISELLQQTFSLSADLGNLIEDIEIEMGSSTEGRELLVETRRVHQQASHLGTMIVERPDHATLVSEYKRFRDLWYPLSARLRPLENRYIERSVRRIRSTDHTLTELLWLEEQVDRQQLLHVTSVLTKDVDEFFSRTPLKLLINLPDGYAVIPLADEFYGVLQNFADVVNRNEAQDDVLAAYEYVDQSGQEFVATFEQINSRSALSVLREIEHSLDSLRESLQLQGGQGQTSTRAIELAASVEILADHLDIDINRWLTRRREPFRTEALKESAAFAQATHQLHEGLINGVSREQLRSEINSLFTRWRDVYGYLAKCDTEDRPILARSASQITPALIELRTLLEP